MTTSGLGSWIPTIGEIIDDALEYAGIDPATANARHLKSAMRSINQVYLWLENNKEALFRDDIETVGIKAGQPFFYAPPGTLSIKKGVLRAVGQPTSYENNIDVFPKAVWFDMPAKGQVGRPTIMALNYSAPVTPDHLYSDTEKMMSDAPAKGGYGDGGYGDYDWATAPVEGSAYTPGSGPQVILWPVPDMDYQLDYIRVRQTQKATQLGQNMDVRSIWINAMTFKLGHYLSLKYAKDKANNLERLAEQALAETNMNNREIADLHMSAASYSPVRSRRRYR
jgi:hypothetical protein